MYLNQITHDSSATGIQAPLDDDVPQQLCSEQRRKHFSHDLLDVDKRPADRLHCNWNARNRSNERMAALHSDS